MTAIFGYILAGILSIISGIVALWKYKSFAIQNPEPIEPLDVPQKPVEAPVEPLPEPVKEIPMPTNTEKLYALSKSLLGIHLGRDKSIPWGVNCANACTDVLIRAGVKGLPPKGIAGTAALLSFLEDSPEFQEVQEYTPGGVIINATGTGNGRIRGHVGLAGNNSIMSNNSETGKWDTQWNWTRWYNYYEKYGGISTRHFVMK